MSRVAIAVLLAVAACPSAQAANNGFDPQKLFVGVGISRNNISNSDDGTGTQVFGGYEFGEIARNIRADAEVGYMDTGNMDLPGNATPPFGTSRSVRAKGLWATGVARFALSPQAELLARAGLDFGDDDGLMVGVGLGLGLSKQSRLRFEYVERNNVNSLQLNLVIKP
jgi:opacity protein-like surface antigen